MNVVFTGGGFSLFLVVWLVVRTDMDAEDADFKNLFVWQLQCCSSAFILLIWCRKIFFRDIRAK